MKKKILTGFSGSGKQLGVTVGLLLLKSILLLST